MHALLVVPVFWGGATPKVRLPDQQGAGSAAIASTEEPTETLIFVNLPGISRSAEPPPETVASRGFTSRDLPITVASPDVAPAVDLSHALTSDDGDAAPESAADQAGHRAELLGRYVGQVKARIERAWLRPRTPIGADNFECRVSVRQNRSGTVGRITLLHCNGDTAWQQSLVAAIQSASPLSAPPEPSVFASTLTITFTSPAYTAGGPEAGYEPAAVMLAQATQVTWTTHDGVIDLRIIGPAGDSQVYESNETAEPPMPEAIGNPVPSDSEAGSDVAPQDTAN